MPGQLLVFGERGGKSFGVMSTQSHLFSFFFFFFFFYCFLLLSNRRRRRDERAEKGDVALSEACLTEIADNLSLPPSLSLTSSILSAENCDVQGRVLLSCCLGNRCNAQRVVLPGSCHT